MVGYVDELEEHALQLRHSGSNDGSAVDHGTLLANQETYGKRKKFDKIDRKKIINVYHFKT